MPVLANGDILALEYTIRYSEMILLALPMFLLVIECHVIDRSS
jgi:hypothetical protein